MFRVISLRDRKGFQMDIFDFIGSNVRVCFKAGQTSCGTLLNFRGTNSFVLGVRRNGKDLWSVSFHDQSVDSIERVCEIGATCPPFNTKILTIQDRRSPVRDKMSFYSEQGTFRTGNRLRCYSTVEDFERDTVDGVTMWAVRGKDRSGGGFHSCLSKSMSRVEMIKYAETLTRGSFVISETSIGLNVVIQGEYTSSHGHHLRFTRENCFLKYLNDVDHFDVCGMEALFYIRKYSDDPDSVLDLENLYGKETDEVIVEFSVFKEKVGFFGSNTVIWEVRSY